MTTDENKSLSRRILKTFSMFGSVEGLLIIVSIIRTKLVAVLLGSQGVGLFGIFYSAMDLIGTTTQLSISDSAVRNLAGCEEENQKHGIMLSIRRWSRILGIFGAVVMLVAAPVFSYCTFSDYSWTWAYASMAVVVFLNSKCMGFQAILRGTELFRSLALGKLYGPAAGLLLSVPMFYFLRLDSIIPSFIAYAVCGYAAMWFFARRLYARRSAGTAEPTMRESIKQGFSFIKLGAYMTVSSFASLGASYAFMAWLNENADTATVGQFNAGFTIVNRYVGIILGAISVEYYPRLAREINKGLPIGNSVETEMRLGLPLLLPCVCVFLLLSGIMVTLLYSSEFEPVVPFVNLAMLGTIFRLFSWCLAFVMLAKGDGRIFVVTEIVSAIVYAASSILCYRSFGIVGLGYSYIIWYGLYTVSVTLVYYLRYGQRLSAGIWGLLALALAVSAITLIFINTGMLTIAIGITVITVLFAYRKVRSAI